MLEKTIDRKDLSTSMESQSSQQSIQKMMKQAMGKQPLRQTTDEVSLASDMQLKSRLVFVHAHQKVYRLRNILVANLLKELGAALPHRSDVRILAPCQAYDSQM